MSSDRLMTTSDKTVQVSVRREGGRARIALSFPVDTESGQRQDSKGRRIPPAYVQTVTVERGGTAAFAAHLGPNLSRMPIVEFDLEGISRGETLKLVWTDQAGQRYEQALSLEGG
jgi:hypothetical protein